METKELKIVPPDGYELDKENSTLERIVFKKKNDDKPRTWEEFCYKYEWTGNEYYLSGVGYRKSERKQYDLRAPINRGYVSNKEEAEAFVALMQLRQLRKAWVGDWEPDWNKDDFKYGIRVLKGNVYISIYCTISSCLTFPTNEMAIEFVDCFKELLEQAKILL